MIKRIVAIIPFIIIPLFVYAVPARPIPQNKPNSDGSVLSVKLHGDEIYHYVTTEDGVPIIQTTDNKYCYAVFNGDSLVSSNILAHNFSERLEYEKRFINDNQEKCREGLLTINRQKRLYHQKSRIKNNSFLTRAKERNNPYIGKKKGLVILVNFADKEMIGDNPNQQFDRLFNEHGYSENNHIGSVHDYFYNQSYGRFDLDFDVIGPVTVSHELSYYGKNDPITGSDKNPREMVAEACRLADPYVNYQDYDWDGDGEVDQVFVIYAGYGESNGAPSNTIWPHESILYGIDNNNFCIDGVRIYTYACSCELAGYSGLTITGIGTPCHEFSHCLGLPDFYDVNYNGGFGMSYWDVMCNGSHSGPDMNGEIPCGFTAYERWFAGWLDFEELTEMERIKDMPALQEQPVAYKITNDNYPDEYFILENRQSDRWFSYLGESNANSGLLVYHVDYSSAAWSSNNVNTNKTHQRMSIVPADNNYGTYVDNGKNKGFIVSSEDLYGDLFPGLNNVTEFSNTSHANVGGKLFNKNTDGTFYLNKPLTNIKNIDGMVSFDFMGGLFVPVPVIENIFDVNDNGFKVTWHSDSPVDNFCVEATEIKKPAPFESKVLDENFDKFITSQTDQDGKFDLSIYIDSYMNSKGWSSENIFTSIHGMKIGGDNISGFISSPNISLSSGKTTLVISCMSNDDNPIPLALSLIDDKGEVKANYEIEGSKSMTENIIVLEDILPGNYNISIKSESGFYLSKLNLYDESYTEDELKKGNGLISILKPVEKITDSDVIDNIYTFENLKGNKYKFRIRACLDEAFSEWSDYIIVDLLNSNFVESVNDEPDTEVKIFDLSGKAVSKPLSSGIYILKSRDKATKIRIQ